MVQVLEQQLVNRIAQIGRDRLPNEACGLLLPMMVNGQQVIELPNRSSEPLDSFEMYGDDMFLALEAVFRGDIPEGMIPKIAAWHTHPGGGVGPSKYDLDNKPAHLHSLVVTLFVDGRPPLATWY